MIDPRYWLPHWRARRALAGYPRYTVPHPQSEATLDAALAVENFDHFMSVRVERLVAFREWLARHFGVAAALDEPGLHVVNAWVELHGGGMVADYIATLKAFAHYQPPWEGPLAGCNVMVDVAIFIGEYLIAQRPRLRWICALDCPKGLVPTDIPATFRPSAYRRVCPSLENPRFPDGNGRPADRPRALGDRARSDDYPKKCRDRKMQAMPQNGRCAGRRKAFHFLGNPNDRRLSNRPTL